MAQAFDSAVDPDAPISHTNQPIVTDSYHEPQPIHRRPPMNRGYSDLGNRIKKRVTLR